MNRPMIDHRGPEFAADPGRDHRRRQARVQDVLRPAAAHLVGHRRPRVGGRQPRLAGRRGGRRAVRQLRRALRRARRRLRRRRRAPRVRVGPAGRRRRPRRSCWPTTRRRRCSCSPTTRPRPASPTRCRELARVGRDAGRIVVVDGVSSISSIDIETDAWGVDVAVSGSQKGWMAPPGIALVSVSDRAWEQQAQGARRRASTSTGRRPRPGPTRA